MTATQSSPAIDGRPQPILEATALRKTFAVSSRAVLGRSGTVKAVEPLDIALYPGMPICQLIVEQVSGKPFRNDSQFQDQLRPGGR